MIIEVYKWGGLKVWINEDNFDFILKNRYIVNDFDFRVDSKEFKKLVFMG